MTPSFAFSASFHRFALLAAIPVFAMLFLLAAGRSEPVPAPAQAADPTANRTVLITGANRGLGLEFARQYKAAGWKVIGTARDPKEATELTQLGEGVQVEALDVADQKSVEALATKLQGQAIDLLINNAGISGAGSQLGDVKVDNYVRVMEVNAIGPMRVTQALLPNLRAGKGRMIVSISSGLGSIAGNTRGDHYAYRESKAALNMFMRTIAAELREEGFICIPMSPGWVQTDMGGPNAQLTPEESIAGMRKVIDNLKPDDSGKFWSYTGEIVPW